MRVHVYWVLFFITDNEEIQTWEARPLYIYIFAVVIILGETEV
jgi:hypothetical protein